MPLVDHVIRVRDGFTCALCDASGKGRYAVHHIVPVEADWMLIAAPSNLVTLCLRCHLYKAHDGCWFSWPLGAFPYLLVDARFDKVREGHRVRSRAFLWAAGVNEKGEREVLGWLDWGGETEVAWEGLFKDLKARGLHGVDLLVSDAHEGLCQAATKAFPGSSWQECQAHFLRRPIEQVKTADQKAFREDVRAVLHAVDHVRSQELLGLLKARWEEKSPKAVDYVEEHLDSLQAVLALPEGHHKRLRTTNMVERFNQELKRKSRLVRVWPNAESRERVYGALLMEQNEAWTGQVWVHMGGPA